MVLAWFDAKEAVSFAQQIARDIDAAFAADGVATAKSAKKHQRKLDAIFHRTSAFSREHPLNVYQKAKFLNTVKWALKEAGHDETFVEEIVGLLTPLLR